MILSLHSIQIQTLVLFIEQPKTLQCVWVHSCRVKGKMEGFLKGNTNQAHTYTVLCRPNTNSKDRSLRRVKTDLDVLDEILKVAIIAYDGFQIRAILTFIFQCLKVNKHTSISDSQIKSKIKKGIHILDITLIFKTTKSPDTYSIRAVRLRWWFTFTTLYSSGSVIESKSGLAVSVLTDITVFFNRPMISAKVSCRN